MNLKLDDITFSHTLRGKWWTFVELYKINGTLPTDILKHSLERDQKLSPDPFWLFTQSAKNYQTQISKLLYHYSNPQQFFYTSNIYGVGTLFAHPDWLSLTTQSQWYWHRVKMNKIANIISYIPGIKQVYLVGSGCLKLSSSASDMDFAVQCHYGCCLLVRFYIKIAIKIIRQDVHSFLKKERTQKGKIDAGIFFEDVQQIPHYHILEERQLSLIMMEKLDPPSHLQLIFTILFLPVHVLFWLVSALQLPFYGLKLKRNPNLIFTHNFISFLPKYYADKKFIPNTLT